MAFCKNCGKPLNEGDAFCPNCGAAVDPVRAEARRVKQAVSEIGDTPDTTESYDPYDIEANKGLSTLCYLSILLLIPWLMRPDSPYIKFHLNRGLVLFFGTLVCAAFLRLVKILFPLLSDILTGLLALAAAALIIIGLVNAASGKARELPLIGRVRLYK